jgi:fermentation-respiration switch protein FrsA (DUF1100 family)
VRSVLVLLVVVVASLWALVVWLQPRMAFFPWTGIQETPARAGLQYTDVAVATADGVTLHGWWMEHPSPRGQVIYWHGNGGNLSLWLDVLVAIRRRGFSVLAVDYRGYGASAGTPSEKGIYLDARAVTGHFTKHLRRNHMPTIYWGRSLGCAPASLTAAESAPDALILESPFPDVRSLFAGNPVMLGLSLFSSYRFATSTHLESYRGPLLVIHGDADSVIPFAAGQQVFSRAPTARKTFVVLQGADHNDVVASHPAYWGAVDQFVQGLSR